MSLHRPLQLLTKLAVTHPRPYRASFQRRWLATPVGAAEAATLPLAGIKVLDMTRVLAGVSISTECYKQGTETGTET